MGVAFGTMEIETIKKIALIVGTLGRRFQRSEQNQPGGADTFYVGGALQISRATIVHGLGSNCAQVPFFR